MNIGKILKRQRVEKELDNLFSYPLTIVSATMGYGKTTSVRSYLMARDVETVWISLLGCDGNETVFWHKLSTAVGKVFPEMGSMLERFGFPMDARQDAEILDLVWKSGNKKTKVIVIDDFHMIEQSKHMAKLIEIFAEEKIPHLHILLISRTRPKINQMNLIAKKLCYYIDTDTLSFNIQEIEEYFSMVGCCLSKQEIERIYRYTNGWISAIYLLLLGVEKGIPVTEVSNITELVNDNLFSSLKDSVKDILIKLSVLDSFTLLQATQILKNSEVPQVVRGLVEQNAFIEYDFQNGVYKLHHVLLDFLRDKIQAENLDVRDVCHNAGRWFLNHGETIQAFDYYHRADKAGEILNIINQNANMRNWLLGFKLLWTVYQGFPEEWYVKYPFPILHFARTFIISGDKEATIESKRIITIMEEYFSKEKGVSTKLRNRVLGEIEIIKIFLVFNEAEKMVELSRKAEKLLEGKVSSNVFRNSAFSFGVPHFLYCYYREAGRLKETLDCIQTGFPPVVFDGSGTGCELVALAEYDLETGDWQNAEIYAQKAIYKAKTMEQTSIIICAEFTLMRILLFKGKLAEAKEIIARMRTNLHQLDDEINCQNRIVYNAAIDMCEGYLYGCRLKREEMPEWLRLGDMDSRVLMLHAVAFPYIIYGKAVMLTKNWVELEVLCESFISRYEVYHNQLGLLHNAIYSAVARLHLYGMESGIASLIPALQDGQKDGILLPFAENADFILPMLYELQSRGGMDSHYLQRLIQISEQYIENFALEKSNPVHITKREKEVLVLLEGGLTQRQMAEQLCISVSSIKKHLESIYSKFKVNNKTSAIKKAHEANIL